MLVRPATVFDLQALWTLWVALQQEELLTWEVPDDRYPLPDLTSPTAQEHFANIRLPLLSQPLSQNICYLLAESDGAIAGYMLSSLGLNPVGWPSVSLRIHEMYVKLEFRRGAKQGASWLLRSTMKDWAKSRGCQAIEVDCIATDAQLSRWESKGFTQYQCKLWKVMEE